MQGINIEDNRNKSMNDLHNPCGKCKNFRMDDIVHNIGHCTLNRMERFAEETDCKQFKKG